MQIRLDHHSGEPIYRQIVEQVKYHFASGTLSPGEQLPSTRALAAELKVNPRTIVKAYEELQALGVVVMKQGQGVFAATNREAAPAQARRAVIEGMAQRLMAEALRLGADPDEALDVVREVAERMGAAR